MDVFKGDVLTINVNPTAHVKNSAGYKKTRLYLYDEIFYTVENIFKNEVTFFEVPNVRFNRSNFINLN